MKTIYFLCSLWSVLVVGHTTNVTSSERDQNVHINVDLQCPSKYNSCQNISSLNNRALTVLDDGLEVMCDTKTDGGGWIVFQRRFNGKVSFSRGWEDYKYGFGDLDEGEFYLGNEHIYRLTSQGQHELRLEIIYKNIFYFAQHSMFRLLDESRKYMLKISGYSGNASDEFRHHTNINFSTYDNDNDNSLGNCAKHWGSGWWFNNCFHINLNGNWESQHRANGTNWSNITSYFDSATFTEMKMRRKSAI